MDKMKCLYCDCHNLVTEEERAAGKCRECQIDDNEIPDDVGSLPDLFGQFKDADTATLGKTSSA
jgi:hypothetical protein